MMLAIPRHVLLTLSAGWWARKSTQGLRGASSARAHLLVAAGALTVVVATSARTARGRRGALAPAPRVLRRSPSRPSEQDGDTISAMGRAVI